MAAPRKLAANQNAVLTDKNTEDPITKRDHNKARPEFLKMSLTKRALSLFQ